MKAALLAAEEARDARVDVGERLADGGGFSSSADRPARRLTLSRFFQDEWPKLLRYLAPKVGAQNAEDVAQEAFMRVIAASNIRSAHPLLYRAASNLAIDEKRRAARTGAIVVEGAMAEAIPDPYPSPEEEVCWRDELSEVSAMLERMSPKCRTVFVLRVFDERSYAEIAEQLNISVLAVEKRMLRAYEICGDWTHRSDGARRRRDRLS